MPNKKRILLLPTAAGGSGPRDISGLALYYNALRQAAFGNAVALDSSGNDNHGTLTNFGDANPYVGDVPAMVNRNCRDEHASFSKFAPTLVNRSCRDVSGQSKHGRILGKSDQDVGNDWQAGGGLNFDGVDDLVKLGAPVSMSGPVTFVMRFSTNNFSANSMIGLAASLSFNIRIVDASTIRARFATTTNFTVPTMSAGTQYSLIVTRDAGGDVRLYLDNEQSSSGALSDPNPATFDLIGGNQAAFFKGGWIDDVRVYSREFSPTEREHYHSQGATGSDPGVGDLFDAPLDDGAQTRYSGTHSLRFDNARSHHISGDIAPANLYDSSDYTLSAWVYSNTPTTGTMSLLDVGTAANSRRISLGYNRNAGMVNYVNSSSRTEGIAADDRQWIHVAATFNNANNRVRLYRNGVLTAEHTDQTNTVNPNLTRFAIGTDVDVLLPLRGFLCGVELHLGELDADGVAALCNNKLTKSSTPVGQWDLNGDATDSSGNGNDGTLQNYVLSYGRILGKSDQDVGQDWTANALRFDGTDDIVTMTATDLPTVVQSSFCFRVKTSRDATMGLISNSQGSNRYILIRPGGATNHVGVNVSGTVQNFTLDPFDDGAEHTLIVTRDDAGDIRAYLDGDEADTVASPGTGFGQNDWRALGVYGGTNTLGFFAGELRDVRVFNRTLTDSEREWYDTAGASGDNPGLGDILQAPLDDGPQTTYLGESAMSFDGVDDYVETTLSGNAAYPVTLSVWMKGRSSGARTYAVCHDHMTSVQNMVGLWNDNYLASSRDDAYQYAEAIGPVANFGEWHHLVAVFAAEDDRKLYLDGVLVAENTDTAIITPLSRGINIGYRGTGSGHFDGDIADARSYQRTLTPDEVAALCNPNLQDNSTPSGKWLLDGAIDPTAPGPVANWTDDIQGVRVGNGDPNRQPIYDPVERSLEFDGVDDRLVGFDLAPIQFNAPRAHVYWLNLDVITSAQHNLQSFYQGTDQREYLRLRQTGAERVMTALIRSNGGIPFGYDFTQVVGSWFMLALIADPDSQQLVLYINDTLVETQAAANTVDLVGITELHIADSNDIHFVDGKYGDIYNYVGNLLSPADIGLLYAYGREYWV